MNTVVTVRVNEELKRQVDDVLRPRGVTLSEAVRQLMLHIARDGKLPFEFILPQNNLVTPEMRYYAATRSRNYFGFSGTRAAISMLYARSASSREVNEAARALGSSQEYYLNMLAQAIEWGHEVWTWNDPARDGKVYQLVFNPDHVGPSGVAPPNNWREMSVLKAPPGVTPTRYQPHRS
jgi:addiction module RelB/DinJ family antitoxin